VCNACLRFRTQGGAGVRTSVHGRFAEYELNVDFDDLRVCFNSVNDDIAVHLHDRLRMSPLKFYLSVVTRMERETDDGTASIITRFASDPLVLLDISDLDEVLDEARVLVDERIAEFIKLGSGWTLVKVDKVLVHTAVYNPIGGSGHIPTPPKIANTHSVLNIQNNDNKCFLWNVLAAVHTRDYKQHAERVSNYERYERELNVDGIHFPVEIGQVRKFEAQNPNFCINVLGLDEDGTVVPLYASRERGRRYLVPLLLLRKGEQLHYTLVRDLSMLLRHRTKSTGNLSVCFFCLHRFNSEFAYKRHFELCSTKRVAKIVMPSKTDKTETTQG
jgi:hypothetical protein